jgi:hypothetical protein
MTFDKLTTWAAALGVATILLLSSLLDGPSDHAVDQAQAADLRDAQLAAQRFERDLRACHKALGPSADLVQIEGTDHYVCREMTIEPTPAEVLQRYALLGGGK